MYMAPYAMQVVLSRNQKLPPVISKILLIYPPLPRMRKNLSTPRLRQMLDANSASDRSSASAVGGGLPSSASSSHLRPTSQASSLQQQQGRPSAHALSQVSQSGAGMRHSSSATALADAASRHDQGGGRTSEQGRDFLIEVGAILR